MCKPDSAHILRGLPGYRCKNREIYHKEIRNYFGSPVYWKAIGQTTKDHHKRCIDKTWFSQNKYELTKEVFSFSKIDAYEGFYDSAFCFYRTRLMTFPGTSDPDKTKRCYISIWKSLQYNQEQYDSKIKEMMKVQVESEKDMMYAAHAISSYMLLRGSMNAGLPILEYQNIKKQLHLIPSFHFPELQHHINNMKIWKKHGFPNSEKLYEKITNLMEPEIKDFVMKEPNYKCFI